MRVLFVVKEYLPKTTPPGVCVMNVQKALLNKGIQSDVLMVGEEEGFYTKTELGDVYCIRADVSYEEKEESIIDFFKARLPMLLTYPVPSTKLVDDYRRYINQLNNQRNYEAIIGVMFPAHICLACSAFDHFILYELDSMVNNPIHKRGIRKLYMPRMMHLERELFDRAEFIIHLDHNRSFYRKDRYNKYSEKSAYAGIPNLIEELSLDNSSEMEDDIFSQFTDDKIVMVYSGLLSKDYRSPSKLLELLIALSEYINLECLFFTRGDCEDELREAEAQSNGVIRRMGYVSQKTLNAYNRRADFFLDIGNRLTGEDYSLPSKVISYMATGKPIIHINGTNDSAIAYLEKYGLSLNVETHMPLTEILQMVMCFISSNKGKRIPFEQVTEMFPENTPEYTADLIVKQIEKRKGKDLQQMTDNKR